MRTCIERIGEEGNQTIGKWFTYDESGNLLLTLGTMELPWRDNQVRISCIPPGTYKMIRHISPRYGECFWIPNVPGRSEILIHDKVNFVGSNNPRTGRPDLQGCIAPFLSLSDLNGDGIKDIASRSSTKALQKILEVLPGKEYEIEIY